MKFTEKKCKLVPLLLERKCKIVPLLKEQSNTQMQNRERLAQLQYCYQGLAGSGEQQVHLEPAQHCGKEVNSNLGCINGNVACKSPGAMLPPFSTGEAFPVYHLQFTAPHFKEDVDSLERVQRRATQMIRGLGAMTHKERLEELG